LKRQKSALAGQPHHAPLAQSLSRKSTLFAGEFQQRGQVKVLYHISQGNNLFPSQQYKYSNSKRRLLKFVISI